MADDEQARDDEQVEAQLDYKDWGTLVKVTAKIKSSKLDNSTVWLNQHSV